MPDIWMDVDAALSEVPVNIFPLTNDVDFKTRETAIAFNQAGMDLVWNFVTPAGAMTQTSVTPTSGGNYDWTHQGDGMYSIEIPASGGASINNDTEGFGWFTGVCTGVLPWRGPIIGFRAAGLNDKLIESAYDTTRGLAGTALPGAAAEAAGGLYTRGSGAGQINQQTNGQVDANLERWINVAPLALTSQRPNVRLADGAAGVITAGMIAADAIGASELAQDAAEEIADYVWDELRSGHVITGSFGQALQIVNSGLVVSQTGTSVEVDTGSASNNVYNGLYFHVTGGTGAGQAKRIVSYVGATKTFTVDSDFDTPLDTDSTFVVVGV